MRLTRLLLPCALLLAAAPALRAEYIDLRSGQRLHVTSYQLVGSEYRLQVDGGIVEVPAEEVVAIDPEDDFAPVPRPAAATAPFLEIVKAAAARYSVDADLISSVIAAESNFDPKAVSKRNARGLMQLLPETAARFGVKNIFDPQENIDAGTHYLRDLLQRYKNDLALALAAYNAGPERVQQFGSVPPYAETVSYILRVKRDYEKSKSGVSLAPVAKPLSSKNSPATGQNGPAGAASLQLNASN
ncbi:MAG: lytic transglycosylase domain-containing protein [Candidatus Acidiferrum sp.]